MNRFAGWSMRFFILLFVSAVSLGTMAVPATIMTNSGAVLEGSLLGLAPTIRLVEPGNLRSIGPASELEVPLSSIKQITIDFPRIIVETADKILIGPLSAFSGIDEILKLGGDRGDALLTIASLRAIALNGNPLHPVPREWLGDRFLTEPKVIPTAQVPSESGCAGCTIERPAPAETPIWNTIHPVLPPPERSSSLPWWLGLIGVAALLGLILFLPSVTGSG